MGAPPSRVLAIDWSGALSGARSRIWIAEVRAPLPGSGAVPGGGPLLTRLESGRTREEVIRHLCDEAARDPALVVGLDFAFSFPAWFCDAMGARTAEEVWEETTRLGEAWLSRCTSPFWGRPGHPRPKLPEHFRATEREVATRTGSSPKSVFQIGGAGSVGTGSIRGMPHLTALSREGFAIVPFSPPRLPWAMEIYPRILTGPVVKSDPEARRRALADGFPEIPEQLRQRAIGSEDAFDAALSAVVMARHLLDPDRWTRPGGWGAQTDRPWPHPGGGSSHHPDPVAPETQRAREARSTPDPREGEIWIPVSDRPGPAPPDSPATRHPPMGRASSRDGTGREAAPLRPPGR